jgi:Protein of unknown function (DUF3800)
VKYRLYIDEAGNADTNPSKDANQRYLSLTGLIFKLDYVAETLHPRLESLKREHFGHHPDTPISLHRKELVNKNFPFNALRDPTRELAFNDAFLELVQHLEYTAFTVTINKRAHVGKYGKFHRHPYHYCLMILLERYVHWLRRHDGVGDVMAESRSGKQDRELKAEYVSIYENGTTHVGHLHFEGYLTSRQIKLKSKRDNISGLQLADLFAHPANRAMRVIYENGPPVDSFGQNITAILEKSKYDRSASGKLDGYGRKWLP